MLRNNRVSHQIAPTFSELANQFDHHLQTLALSRSDLKCCKVASRLILATASGLRGLAQAGVAQGIPDAEPRSMNSSGTSKPCACYPDLYRSSHCWVNRSEIIK